MVLSEVAPNVQSRLLKIYKVLVRIIFLEHAFAFLMNFFGIENSLSGAPHQHEYVFTVCNTSCYT